MAHSQRQQRVADQIQRELASIIAAELKDPRVGLVTLTGVDLSPDLAHARVYYTTLVEGAPREEVARGLAHAAGFMRSQLGKRIKLHVTPELHFHYDTSVEQGLAVDRLIDQALGPPKRD